MWTLRPLLCQPTSDAEIATKFGTVWTQMSILQLLHANETSENITETFNGGIFPAGLDIVLRIRVIWNVQGYESRQIHALIGLSFLQLAIAQFFFILFFFGRYHRFGVFWGWISDQSITDRGRRNDSRLVPAAMVMSPGRDRDRRVTELCETLVVGSRITRGAGLRWGARTLFRWHDLSPRKQKLKLAEINTLWANIVFFDSLYIFFRGFRKDSQKTIKRVQTFS